MRIVDEAFPTDGGAGFLKVDAHDDAKVLTELLDGGMKQGGVFACSFDIMDGAGTDEYEEARIAVREDAANVEAGVEDGGRGGFGNRAFLLEEDGGQNDGRSLDPEIFSHLRHGWVSHGHPQ